MRVEGPRGSTMLGLDQEPVSCCMEPWDSPLHPRVQGICLRFHPSLCTPASPAFPHGWWHGLQTVRRLLSCSRGGHISTWSIGVGVCPDPV